MNKKKILNYYSLDFILSIYFDSLEENKNLSSIIDLNNQDFFFNKEDLEEIDEIKNNYKHILDYSIQNNILEDYYIDKIFKFHEHSKCILIKKKSNQKKLFLYSVTKHNHYFIKNILFNKNRLKFLPINLECINKSNCKIYHGVYDELFQKYFFKDLKLYLLTLDNSINIELIGKSINGMTNIVLGYLISILLSNKINIYSYSICKFCNQDFIDEIEKKQNIELNIINHKYDTVQLLIKPFTLNFKNLIIVDKNNLTIQSNKDENQDKIISSHFIFNLFSYSLKYHSSIQFFKDLLSHDNENIKYKC
jgi:hypothetical protein